MSSRAWWGIAAVVVLGLAGYGITHRPQPKQAPPAVALPVEVSTVASGTVVERVAVTGSIKSPNESGLIAQVPGRVVRVLVQEGDRVRQGQPLLQLDPTEYQATVRQAQAGVYAAQTRLAQAKTAAAMQTTASSAAVQQAQAGVQAARDRLEIVRKGARTQERAMAQNRVNQASANLRNAETNLRRAKSLLAEGAVSQQNVDTAQTAYEVAKADYDSAKEQASLVQEGARSEEVSSAEAGLRQAEEALRAAQAAVGQDEVRRQDVLAAQAGLQQAQAALVQAKEALAHTTLVSPLTGAVIMRNVDVGEYIGPGGDPRLRVAELSTLEFEALVSETDVARVRLGQPVAVRVDALPGRHFEGRVSRLVPAAQNGSRSFRVKVELPNGDGALQPGMFARGEIRVLTRYGVTLVPKDALLSEAGSNRLALVRDGKATFRTVRVGYSDAEQVEVISGAAPGDRVITAGKTRVNDGDPVRITAETPWQPTAVGGES